MWLIYEYASNQNIKHVNTPQQPSVPICFPFWHGVRLCGAPPREWKHPSSNPASDDLPSEGGSFSHIWRVQSASSLHSNSPLHAWWHNLSKLHPLLRSMVLSSEDPLPLRLIFLHFQLLPHPMENLLDHRPFSWIFHHKHTTITSTDNSYMMTTKSSHLFQVATNYRYCFQRSYLGCFHIGILQISNSSIHPKINREKSTQYWSVEINVSNKSNNFIILFRNTHFRFPHFPIQ